MAGRHHRLSDREPAGAPAAKHVIFLSVGEPSGDLHGAALAYALKARIPGVRLLGLGGPAMARAGVELLAGLDDLAVMGFVEVLSRLPFFLRLRRRVFDTLEAEGVDLVIPIDYPGFNLRLARHAHGRGRRVLYYIAPQVWAWHASRTAALARDTDRVAVILPFEEEFLRDRGANAEFVGHPLLDVDPGPVRDHSVLRADLGVGEGEPILALMPGSRRQEIDRHLAVFCGAAELVRRRRPEVRVMIGAPPGMATEVYGQVPYPVVRDAAALLHHATAALVKSGTTTLETALAGVPFVVAYRMNPLTFGIARRVVRVPHIALANLVAGRAVAPEFVQKEATPEALADRLLPLLEPGNPTRTAMIAELGEVRGSLGRGGAADRVAEIAAELLGSG